MSIQAEHSINENPIEEKILDSEITEHTVESIDDAKKKRNRKTQGNTEILSTEKSNESKKVGNENCQSQTSAENKQFFSQLNHFANDSDRGGSDLFIFLAKGKYTVLAEPENPSKKPSNWLYLDEKTGIWKDDRLYNAENFSKQIIEYLIQKLKIVNPQKESEKVQKITDLIKRLNKKSFAENIIIMASRGDGSLVSDPLWYDNKVNFLPCKNGILVDLENSSIEKDETGNYKISNIEYRQIASDDYITKTFCPFNIKATCPQWEAFLNSSLEGETPEGKNVISFLQKFIGYSAAGYPNQDLFLVNTGRGRNGKGIFSKTLRSVFNNFAVVCRSEMFLKQKFSPTAGGATPHLADLYGARLAILEENNPNEKWNAGEVKTLTSFSDDVKGRKLYDKDYFSFTKSHTFIYDTNDLPSIGNPDYAFLQRLLLLEWKLSFVDEPKEPFEREKDPDLEKKLKKELSGILNWIIVGYCRYKNEGLLDVPECMKLARNEYASSQDTFTLFIKDCCVDSAEGTKIKEIWSAYKNYCLENNLHTLSKRVFIKTLKSKGYETFHTMKGDFVYLSLVKETE